jgi:predicted TIM-barrel fold metal-dependent hydrolase
MASWPAEILRQKMPVNVGVDCHVHLFPDELFASIGRWFAGAGWQLPYPCRTADILQLMQTFGVEQIWALPYAHKPGVAAELNAYIAGVAAANPEVVGFFSVHAADPDPAAIARQALDELGLRGMKLHAEVQGTAVDDPRLDAVFDLLEERGAPCVLHSANAPYPAGVERLRVGHMVARLERNPRLKAVAAHLGAPDTRAYLALLDRFPNLHLEVSFAHVPPLHTLAGLSPDDLAPYARRLLFGSDFPYITFPYIWQVDAWRRVKWVQEHLADFFGGNARRLLAADGSRE